MGISSRWQVAFEEGEVKKYLSKYEVIHCGEGGGVKVLHGKFHNWNDIFAPSLKIKHFKFVEIFLPHLHPHPPPPEKMKHFRYGVKIL